MRIIRTVIAILFFLLFTICFVVWSMLTLCYLNLHVSAYCLKFWGRGTLKILGIPLMIEGDWALDPDSCNICICNHQSTLDIVWFCAVCPVRFGGVGKKELKWIPVFNIIWMALGLYYVDRSSPSKAIETFQHISEDIKKNKRSFTVSPEGTRSTDGRMRAFKKGAFHLALQSQAPICPVVVAGAHEAMPKGSYLYRRHLIHLRFLPQIDTSQWQLDSLEQHIKDTHAIVETAYHQLRSELGLQSLT